MKATMTAVKSKIVLFILTLLSYGILQSQSIYADKSMPFQVLRADGAVNAASKEVKSLDLIHINDHLTNNEGQLILVHYTGRYLLFENDTTVSVEALNNFLLPKKRMKRKEHYRPQISILFENKVNKKNRLSRMGACFDCGRGNIVFNPGKYALLSKGEDLSIDWIQHGSNAYKVTLMNEFSDQLYEVEVDTNHLKIDFDILQSIKPDLEVLIIGIQEKTTEEQSYHGCILTFNNMDDSQRKAMITLKGAFRMELDNVLFKHAKMQYELAYELSNKDEYYKTMLDNYLLRNADRIGG